MDDCIFCKIAAGDIPSDKVYEDETVLAFRDIHPQAPVHILFIPKEHAMDSCAGVTAANAALVAHLFEVIAAVARREGLTGGFRVVTNSGPDGAQSVPHLHFHLLGGRALSETMS